MNFLKSMELNYFYQLKSNIDRPNQVIYYNLMYKF